MKQNTYVFAHWADPRVTNGGEPSGSGYTVVRAGKCSIARELVWQYLCSKPGGNSQCAGRACLELKDIDEVGFVVSGVNVSQQATGVVAEFALTSEDWSAEPILVYSAGRLPSLLHYNAPGHPREFVLIVGQFPNPRHEMVPSWFCRQLQERLPSYSVDNRGTRIELMLKTRSDQLAELDQLREVLAAAKEVFGPVFAEGVGVLVANEKQEL